MARREREGRSIPAGYLDRPELPADLVFVWEAFWKLHTERPMGMGGQGAIPHSAILFFGQRLGMGRDEADWFVDLVGAMDEAWFTHQRERREAETRIEEAEKTEGAKQRLPGPR